MIRQLKSFAKLVVKVDGSSAFATHRKSTKAVASLTLIKEVAGVFGLGSCFDILREVS